MPIEKIPLRLQFALYWLMILTGLFIGSVMLHWLGISVTPFHLPLVALTSVMICWKISFGDERALSLAMLVVTLVLFFAAVFIFGRFVALVSEYSYLGRGAYSDGIIALTSGWNPIFDGKTHLSELVYRSPRATWYVNSVLLSFLGEYEMAKQQTILFAVPAFFLTWHYFLAFTKQQRGMSFLLAFISICSPVALSQLFTFYDDAAMAYVLQCMLLLMCYLLDAEEINRTILFVLSGVWIFLFHMPQNGSRLAIVLAIGFFMVMAYRYGKWVLRWGAMRFGFVAFFCVVVLGYQPMIQSIIDHQPIFSLYFQNLLYVQQQEIPGILEGQPRVLQGLLSLMATPEETTQWIYHPYIKLMGIGSSGFATPDVPLQGFGALSLLLFFFTLIALLYVAIFLRGTTEAVFEPEMLDGAVAVEERFTGETAIHSMPIEGRFFSFYRQFWFMVVMMVAIICSSPQPWLARTIAIAWFLIPLSMAFLSRQYRAMSLSLIKVMLVLVLVNVVLFACVSFPRIVDKSHEIAHFWQRMSQEELPTKEDAQTFNTYHEDFPSWSAMKQSGREPWKEKAIMNKVIK